MSDFLSNLVTRSLDAAPVIQPRLPSLFEPAKPYMGSLAEASREREEGLQEAPAEPAFEHAGKPPSAPRERQATANQARTEGSVSPELPTSASQPFRAVEPSRGSAVQTPGNVPPQAMNEGQRDSAPAVRPAAAQAPPDKKPMHFPMPPTESLIDVRPRGRVPDSSAFGRRAPAGDLIEPVVMPKSAAFVPDRPTDQRTPTRSEVPERATRNSTPAKTGAPRQFHEAAESHANLPSVESPRLRSEDAAPRTPAAIDPASTPRFEFARHVPPAPHVSPPEPTIQVTIGRIEVRAVSSQVATPRERPASPVMSLNDYLHSRRGGT
jgi:hypothetical protein